MIFDWNKDKNNELQEKRNITFERVVIAINEGATLDILEHPNKEKYRNQYLIIVDIDDYAYVVPSVINDDIWFLKTIFPSRKYTKLYITDKRGNQDE